MSINTLRTAKINGQKVNVFFTGSYITFPMNLFNGQSLKIHIKYKSIRYDVNLLYNTHYIDNTIRGRHVKYSLFVPDKLAFTMLFNYNYILLY